MKPLKKSVVSSKPISYNKLTKTHAGLVILRRFQNIIARKNLLPRGSKLIVAVSGGPDSMMLLALLDRLRSKHDFTLRVAHVNYGLRGHESDQDEKIVEQYCNANNIPFSVLRTKMKPSKNIEQTLRTVRYAWFERLRQKYRYDAIVTAHTMNDLAETVLLNLIRGSGLSGLSPFQRTHSHLLRPLIFFTRADIETFLEAEHISFRIDQSNFSKKFTRNRVRHELIPLLKTFNPSIIQTLAKTATVLGEKEASSKP